MAVGVVEQFLGATDQLLGTIKAMGQPLAQSQSGHRLDTSFEASSTNLVISGHCNLLWGEM